MELEGVRSDLNALMQLYGLLQSSGDFLLSASAENLDDKAKILLKDLLDRATERVFETHSKIIAAQSSISNKLCSTPLNQPEPPIKLQPPTATAKKNSSRDFNFHTIVSPKDEKSLEKPMHEGKVPEVSKASIPPTKTESRNKRCRVCQQSSNNQPNVTKGVNTSKENTQSPKSIGNDQDQKQAHVQQATRLVKGLVTKKELVVSVENMERSGEKRTHGIKCNSTAVKSLYSSSGTRVIGVVKASSEHSLAGEIDKKLEGVDYLSEEVSEAIKRIKSRLQALQLLADPLKENSAVGKGSCRKVNVVSIADKVHAQVKMKEVMATRSERSQDGGGSVLGENVLPSQQINQRLCKLNDPSLANKVLSKSQKLVSGASDQQSLAAGQEPLRKISDQLSQLGSQNDGNRGTTLPGTPLNLNPTGEGLDLPNQDDSKNVKAIVEKIESLSQLKSENDHLPSQARNYVRGLRFSPSQAKLGQGSNWPAKMPSLVNKQNTRHDPMAQNETTRELSMPTQSLLPRSLEPIDSVQANRKTQAPRPRHKMNQSQAREMNKKHHMPHRVIMRPTLLDCNSSKIMVQPTMYDDLMEDRRTTSGIRKNIHVGPQSKNFPRQQISQETSSSSGSSSSWTSQQTSTTYNESETESEGYLPSHQRGSQLSGSTSRRLGRDASYSSSLESSSLSHGRGSGYRNLEFSRRGHPKKEFRLEGRTNPEKQIGRLRRLKNKLGLVFHHHHHHHHHHHNNDDSERAEAAHAMSLWTNTRKIFHHSNKKKVFEEHSVKNSKKKAVVSNVPSKNQQGHFHSLVEGLMRHVQRSKKSKPSKGGLGQLGNGHHGHNKKVVKKLHWWQMLKHKRGVKLSNKGRVKLGYTSKNPQFRAGKMR